MLNNYIIKDKYISKEFKIYCFSKIVLYVLMNNNILHLYHVVKFQFALVVLFKWYKYDKLNAYIVDKFKMYQN